MEITTLIEKDLDSISALQPPDWPDIVPYMRNYLQSPDCFPIKIITDNTIVGIGTTIQHEDTAWLAHIIVHPEFRNQGIGEKVTRALADSIDPVRFETIFLVATPLGVPVYLKIGFEKERDYLFFKEGKIGKELITAPQIRQLNKAYIDDILQFDREVSGENRSVLLKRYLDNGFVYLTGNHLEGYYLPDLGDGVIVAQNDTAGIAMMEFRLQSRDVAIVPEENQAAVGFLTGHDFKVFRKGTRMRLGKKRTWQPEKLYNRIGGHLG